MTSERRDNASRASDDPVERAAEIADWLRYHPYVPASVREALLSEVARLRLGRVNDDRGA